jgi:hypothetical protein
MAPVDSAIARLYQAPLGAFIAERNALARSRTGAEAAAIKALAKPSVPAWAANQLHWQKRAVYDRLVRSARALRQAHLGRLSGKGGAVDEAERAHAEAVRAAMDEVRVLLAAAGDPATPATLAAVLETLQALPSTDPPGQLVRALRPQGFEALAALGRAAPPLRAVPAARGRDERPSAPAPEPTSSTRPMRAGKAQGAAAARRAEADAARARQARARQLAEAVRAERAAHKALDRARVDAVSARRERDRLADALQFAERRVKDTEGAVVRLEREARLAAQARDDLA